MVRYAELQTKRERLQKGLFTERRQSDFHAEIFLAFAEPTGQMGISLR